MFRYSKVTPHVAIYLAFLISSKFSYTTSQLLEPPAEAPEPPEAEAHYEKCDLPYLGKDEPQPVPEGFLPMGPNSKYFIIPGENNVPIKEVASLCSSFGLQPAEVRNNVELMALNVFIKENVPDSETQTLKFSLGLNDEKDEGSFVEFDGTPMKFHAFGERQPNNQLNTESCVEVGLHSKYQQLYYNDVDCNQGTTPVCMFKPSDECFLGSPLTLAKINQEFELLGSTAVRDYYIRQTQQPWSDAVATCAREGFKLVDFSTGLSNNQILYDMIKKWTERNYIFQAIPFWTGAKLVPVDTVGFMQDTEATSRYKFETSGKFLNDLSEWPSLSWDEDEPSDSSGLDLEQCISAILYEPYQSTGNNRFILATTNCRLPQYPLCYRDKGNTITNETVPDALAGRMDDDLEQEDNLDEESVDERGAETEPGKFCTLEEVKIDASKPQLTVEDVLKLAAVSRNKGLNNYPPIFKWDENLPHWVKDTLKFLIEISEIVCPSSFVPKEFLRTMYNLLVLYYNSVVDKVANKTSTANYYEIRNTRLQLSLCKKSAPLAVNFESVGGLPTKSKGESVEPITELIEQHEITGIKYYPDIVIDVLWYMYQISVSSCYHTVDPPSNKTMWLQTSFNEFSTYFLEPLQKRWISTLPPVDYGVILGDMDVDAVYYSLRACAVASFQNNNISELYFPRPLHFPTDTNDETFNLKRQALPKLKQPSQDELDDSELDLD